jgi:hypothetical protein
VKTSLIATLLGGLYCGSAFANLIAIDDFSVNQGPVSDTIVNKIAVTESNAVRTLSVDLLSARRPIRSQAEVVDGVLDIENGSQEDSQVKVIWTLAAHSVPANARNVAFLFGVVASDANPADMAFKLGGNSIASFAIPPNTDNKALQFDTDAKTLNAGGVLELTINGAPGWDLTLERIGLSFDLLPAAIAEPSVVALLGLGLLGIGLVRGRLINPR